MLLPCQFQLPTLKENAKIDRNKDRTAGTTCQVTGGSVSGLGRAYAIAVLLVAKPAFNVIVTQVQYLYKTQVVNLCYQQRKIALPQKDAHGDLPV